MNRIGALVVALLIHWPVGLALAVDPAPEVDPALSVESILACKSDDQGVAVSEAGKPVLYYQRATKSLDGGWPRAHYVHPLYGLDGQILTEDFPEDHKHHRGIFWAWHQVWVGDQKLGDPWVCRDFAWDVIELRTQAGSDRVEIQTIVLWKSPQLADDSGQPIAVVRESTTITVYRADHGFRIIDFDLSLLALLEGVRIGGSEDSKGYGGFSPRIRLQETMQFESTAGKVQPQTNAISAGTWMNISAADYGVVVMNHPQNPGDPRSWILRNRRSMQNAVYPGRHPVAIPTDSPTRLRYRLLVHQGDLSRDEIQVQQANF